MTLLMRDRENRKIGMEVGILGTERTPFASKSSFIVFCSSGYFTWSISKSGRILCSNSLRHEYMTLLMRDRENRKIGMEVGILGTVSSLRDFNIPDAEIFQKIQEKYNLSPEEAERYMKTEAEA